MSVSLLFVVQMFLSVSSCCFFFSCAKTASAPPPLQLHFLIFFSLHFHTFLLNLRSASPFVSFILFVFFPSQHLTGSLIKLSVGGEGTIERLTGVVHVSAGVVGESPQPL